MDGETLEQLLKDESPDLHVVDVREREEQVHGIIPGALCLPRGVVDRDIGRFVPITDNEAQLVLYCAGGVRSILAAEAVKRLGYKHVISLRGGMRGWEIEGRPIEKV
ncbi:putative thiosulfate sulfurtransferase glpE [Syncephalis fuscata]|nr:putative thiosulfate sulfurtransferase glpE [Syncephalis fuscata]